MDVKRKKSGFTIVELLTVLVIITMLVGLLVPALNLVRNISKETKQKAQLMTIGLALTTFKNDSDYGDYPRSNWPIPPALGSDYCGAQKLAEALLGWDLLGFHPKTAWRADGLDGFTPPGLLTYDPPKRRDDDPQDGIPDTLNERRGPYIELATTNAFRLGNNPARLDPDGLFDDTTPLHPDTYVICDVFSVKKITIIRPGPGGRTDIFKAGTPILYYRANTSSKNINHPVWSQRIYNVEDNLGLVGLGRITDRRPHALDPVKFYETITDPKATTTPLVPWPYRPDSYLLISAGLDGEYGTKDDIRNFGN